MHDIILIKPDEQEMTRALGEIHVTHWVGENKLPRDLRTCLITKNARGPVISGAPREFL